MTRIRTKPALPWHYLFLLLFSMCFFIFLFNQHGPLSSATYLSVTTEASLGGVVPSVFNKHVTKSLAELGPMDEINRHTVLFNRVPRSGSEMLVLLMQWLQGWNGFRHIRLKGDDRGSRLSRVKQERLVDEIMDAMRNQAVPLTFDRHAYFVNFTSFGKQSPIYLNLVRDPAERLVSRYYQGLKDAKHVNRLKLLEECIATNQPNCLKLDKKFPDPTIPYFCGHDRRCMIMNDKWALNQAKENVEHYYPVVGVLEELNSTLEVLESKLPYFFKGVLNLYYRDILGPQRKKHTMKQTASGTVTKYVQERLATEYDFYEWIKSRLFRQLQMLYGDHGGHNK